MTEPLTPPGLQPITLDGVQFDYAGETELTWSEPSRTLAASVGGKRREHLTWWGEPALAHPNHLVPTRRRLLALRIAYGHLRGQIRDTVEDLLAVPGVHQVAPWRPVRCTWLSDGATAKLWAPWTRADELLAVPTHLAGRVDPVVKVGRTGTPLDVVTVSTATFDDVTDPVDEAWWEEEGQRIRLPEAAASGAYVYARWYPLVRMYEAAEEDRRQYTGARPLAEPREIVLVEAG